MQAVRTLLMSKDKGKDKGKGKGKGKVVRVHAMKEYEREQKFGSTYPYLGSGYR